MLKERTVAITVPIYTRNDSKELSKNYRRISLVIFPGNVYGRPW